ncbi:nicotinate-nucleotide adenylyltransferase [Thermanaerothrix sp. 4228-RoL]|jgi:nicotinate-nucleotide adenylyltransferase|uniref:Probable nicotinate-nucleotide adenylyltransferase n=1 Tax=Thermanaerothrix solaris TaxID=3058434 RepID=A0ABU3NKM8_9CHLR|nr:nicotinate-nucleotide adenylyltransferase [Thermanaerothrix sp. 4228-RoL]MDT8897401.1 nicotinate-nucleotide adenylyltransferase [Thermanaerothrix sp. 4228-RoL]
MSRLGIFGGTFDPPHVGHLILASEAADQLHLDRVLWVLTPDPPHKRGQPITPLAIRLEMVMAAIQDDPSFELSRVEIDRPGPHYAVDTLRILHDLYPEDRLIYLIGGDSLRDLPTWRQPLEFLKACDGLGVMRRPGDAVDLSYLEAVLPGLERKVMFVDAPLLEISSSQIRQRVAGGKAYRYYLPPQVYALVEKYRLYRTT